MTEAVNALFYQHLHYRRLNSITSLEAGDFVAPPNGFEKVTLSTHVLKTRVKFLQILKLLLSYIYLNLKFRIFEC